MSVFADYEAAFDNIAFRLEDGILELRFHTDGGPLCWTGLVHQELPKAFALVGDDPSIRLVIMTGTGGAFCDRRDGRDMRTLPLGEGVQRHGWNLHEKAAREARRTLDALLDIDVPIVAAVNGPAIIHAELALLSDIVLCADHAFFMDEPHGPNNLVPGDGVHAIWPMLIGPSRARYFLLTGQQISAAEARDLGFVHEVLAPDRLMERAWELARQLNGRSRLTLRYSRQLLVHRFKKALLEELNLGLAMEGIGIAAAAAERPAGADPPRTARPS